MKINTKIASSIAGASAILTLMGIISKGIGFIREIIYANNFGLSSEFDLYLTSAALPLVINTSLIYLCQHYFIPAYNKVKKESEPKSIDFFNYIFWWFIFVGISIAVLLFICSGLIINFYLSSISFELQQKGLQIFSLFLITIPLNAGMSVITAYLQANFNFVYPAASQIVLNIVVIILIIFFTEIFRIFVLPLSFVMAYIIAFIFLFNLVKDKLKFVSGHILKLRYNLSHINTLISLVFIEGLSLSYVLIDRYFIGKVPEGGIAALNYALIIFSLPVAIFSLPLLTTMFSKFSQSSSNSPEMLRTDFMNASKINLFIIIPVAFVLFLWGDFFLHIFYERGEFTAADTLLTYTALQYYTLGLVFFSTYLIMVKLLYSINKYNLILIISVIAFLLKIFLNFLLVDNLKQNGLALSTSIIYMFLFIAGFYLVMKKINIKENFIIINLIYFATNAIVSFLIVYVALNIVNTNAFFSNILGLIIFLGIYTLNSFLKKDSEFRLIKKAVLNIFT